MAGGWNWIFTAAAGAMALMGLALGVWALFWDRSRGRERCPQCWYSLIGVPDQANGTRICPECGRAVQEQKRLFRTRRRWRWGAVGVVLLSVAAAINVVPRVRAGGWISIVPSSVLVLVADGQMTQASVGIITNWISTTAGTFQFTTTPARQNISLPISQVVDREAFKRMAAGKLAHWQARVLLDKYFANHPLVIEDIFDIPRRWVSDKPLPALRTNGIGSLRALKNLGLVISFRVVGSNTGPIYDISNTLGFYGKNVLSLGLVQESTDAVIFELSSGSKKHSFYMRTLECDIEIVSDRSLLLERIDSPAANELARQALDPRMKIAQGSIELILSDHGTAAIWSEIDFSLAYTVDLVLDETIIASGSGVTNWDYPVWKDWEIVDLSWYVDDVAQVRARIDEVQIVVRGNEGGALIQYLRNPFGKKAKTWAGQFVVSGRVERE